MKGRLTLLFKDQIVQTKEYVGPKEKNKIIDGWKKQYGKGYKNTELKDEPVPPTPRGPRPKKAAPKNKAIGVQPKYLTKNALKIGYKDFK